MDFTLTSKGAVRYSPEEQRIFRLLPKDGRQRSSTAILNRFYGVADQGPPFHKRKIVIGLLSSLMRKTDCNKEHFRVCKTKRSGPIPISFWLEPRRKKNGKAHE